MRFTGMWRRWGTVRVDRNLREFLQEWDPDDTQGISHPEIGTYAVVFADRELGWVEIVAWNDMLSMNGPIRRHDFLLLRPVVPSLVHPEILCPYSCAERQIHAWSENYFGRRMPCLDVRRHVRHDPNLRVEERHHIGMCIQCTHRMWQNDARGFYALMHMKKPSPFFPAC